MLAFLLGEENLIAQLMILIATATRIMSKVPS